MSSWLFFLDYLILSHSLWVACGGGGFILPSVQDNDPSSHQESGREMSSCCLYPFVSDTHPPVHLGRVVVPPQAHQEHSSFCPMASPSPTVCVIRADSPLPPPRASSHRRGEDTQNQFTLGRALQRHFCHIPLFRAYSCGHVR